MINKLFYVSLAYGVLLSVTSCEDQKFNNTYVDVDRVHVDTLSAELQKVRDYVPDYAVVAHRGSTFWAPEETESSYRWARETGADYLEADLQVSKDGVILALHDSDLKRTTNIENVFGETLPVKERKEYYKALGYSDAVVEEKVKADIADFVPNYPCSYTYYELMMLDAGKWFNETSVEQAQPGYESEHQYISTLEDLIMYSKGYKLDREDNPAERNPRKFEAGVANFVKTGKTITNPLSGQEEEVVKYNFSYTEDDQWSGNIPGIYIELKETWLNPSGFEQMVAEELTAVRDMNIMTAPATSDKWYISKAEANRGVKDRGNDILVNVGETNGKVILQTFSLQSLVKVGQIFKGEIPMCFLLWKGTGATDLTYDDPQGYASFINLAIQNKAHYIGPCIAGAPNNYPELNQPWQHDLIHRAKMKNHPYSFDTYDQMAKYFGVYNHGNSAGIRYQAPYLDAFFTNHTDMSLKFMLENKDELDQIKPGMKAILDARPQIVPEPLQLLKDLGYTRK